jgi:hypothetical protein
MRVGVLVIGIVLLVVANVLVMMGFPGRHSMEGFVNYFMDGAGTGSDYQPMSS